MAQLFWTDQFQLDWQRASPAFLLTATVAEYAEILRGSYWAQEGSLDDALSLAYRAGDELAEDERIGQDVSKFIQLVERARSLERQE